MCETLRSTERNSSWMRGIRRLAIASRVWQRNADLGRLLLLFVVHYTDCAMFPRKFFPATIVSVVLALGSVAIVISGSPRPGAYAEQKAADSAPAPASDRLDRTVLPIPEPKIPHSTVFDARNATPPPRFEVKAPAGAPNVLIVLIDDMGFGMSSAFGGPINMPTVDRLAKGGLRYNHFHTTALCSPTRAALLTGRNHHSVGMQIDIGKDDHDHLITTEERFSLAMARQ